jgi:hypothetical protein
MKRLLAIMVLAAPFALLCWTAPRAAADGPLLPGFESGSTESEPATPAPVESGPQETRR